MLQHQLITITRDKGEAQSRTLLTMSSFQDGCNALRQSCGLQWLTQLLYGDVASDTRQRAEQALYNVVQSNPDNQQRHIETRIFALLENLQDFCDLMQAHDKTDLDEEDFGRHPMLSLNTLQHMSTDHSQAVTQLGGVHVLAQLIKVDLEAHCIPTPFCINLCEVAVRILRDLTRTIASNAALLCSLQGFMPAMVTLLESSSLTLQTVAAELLDVLFSCGVCIQLLGAGSKLLQIAMRMESDTPLQALLSLSANYPATKTEIFSTDGALAFLVMHLMNDELTGELVGGIVKNISADIAESEGYRSIFRQHLGLHALIHNLYSLNTQVVSNTCATLKNLSAGCDQDQIILLEMGAVDLLQPLVNSQSKTMAQDAIATLRNLRGSKMNLILTVESCENVGSFQFSFKGDELKGHVETTGKRKRCFENCQTTSDARKRNKQGHTKQRHSKYRIGEPSSKKPGKHSQNGLDKHGWIEPERQETRINSVYDTLCAVKQCLSVYEFSLMSDSEDVVGPQHLSVDEESTVSGQEKTCKVDGLKLETKSDISDKQPNCIENEENNFIPNETDTCTDHKTDLLTLKDEACIGIPMKNEDEILAPQHSTDNQLGSFVQNTEMDVTPSREHAEMEHHEIKSDKNACCSDAASIADNTETPDYAEACQTSPMNLCTKSNSGEVKTGIEQEGEAEQPNLDNRLDALSESLYKAIQDNVIGQHLTVDSFRAVREIAATPLKISVSRDAYVVGVKLLVCRADKSLGEHYTEQIQIILTDDARVVHASVIFCGEVKNCEVFTVKFQIPCEISADVGYALQVKYPRCEKETHLCLIHTPLTLMSASTGLRLNFLEEVSSPITEVMVAEKVLCPMECRRG